MLCPENIQHIVSFLVHGQDNNGSELVQASYSRLENTRSSMKSNARRDTHHNECEDRFKIFFRKRPLLQWELDKGAYDVITTKVRMILLLYMMVAYPGMVDGCL